MPRRIDAQEFDPQAAYAVADDVDREQTTAGYDLLAIEPQQERDERQVPQQLVQERRLVGRLGGVFHRTMLGIDAHRPGQRRRTPEEFLVEPVADTADGLREWQRRRDDIDEIASVQTHAFRVDHARADAGDQTARNTETALPDRQSVIT